MGLDTLYYRFGYLTIGSDTAGCYMNRYSEPQVKVAATYSDKTCFMTTF